MHLFFSKQTYSLNPLHTSVY